MYENNIHNSVTYNKMLLHEVSLLPKASQNTKDEVNWPKRSYIKTAERSPKSTPFTSLSCFRFLQRQDSRSTIQFARILGVQST